MTPRLQKRVAELREKRARCGESPAAMRAFTLAAYALLPEILNALEQYSGVFNLPKRARLRESTEPPPTSAALPVSTD